MKKNYYTIKEASKITEIPPPTLRYWEEKFRLLKPLRLSSGHRRYTIKDIETINKVKNLVFIKGFSLSGARKILNSKKIMQDFTNNQNTGYFKEKIILNVISEIKRELNELITKIQQIRE